MEVRLFKREDAVMTHTGGPPGEAGICRLVTEEISKTLGAGLASFDECSVEWTVTYDEVVVVLEGEFRLRLGDRLIVAKPGDVMWIPANTSFRYEGTKAVICYAVYPVDWRTRKQT